MFLKVDSHFFFIIILMYSYKHLLDLCKCWKHFINSLRSHTKHWVQRKPVHLISACIVHMTYIALSESVSHCFIIDPFPRRLTYSIHEFNNRSYVRFGISKGTQIVFSRWVYFPNKSILNLNNQVVSRQNSYCRRDYMYTSRLHLLVEVKVHWWWLHNATVTI